MAKNYDIIIWGGTSFVGKLTVKHFLETYGLGETVRWAMGARDRKKLEAFRDTLGEAGANIPLLIGDAKDKDFVLSLAEQTKVILTTVGPYGYYGKELIAACAQAGTDYCDLTGEVLFVEEMRKLHHDKAVTSGARILNFCGVDSIPSDLGVWQLNQIAMEKFGEHLTDVSAEVTAFKGAFSGGTIASMKKRNEDVKADPSLKKKLGNPYLLVPDVSKPGVRQPPLMGVTKSRYSDNWLAPFVMAGINTRVVHASNAIMGYPYGDKFTYSEKTGLRNRLKATMVSCGLMSFGAMMMFAPTRALLLATVLPKPGEGPTEETQRTGKFRFEMYGKTSGANHVALDVYGERDPGYGATCRMIGEVAVCLAQDVDKDALGGGFWTTASSIPKQLIPRLEKHAGMQFIDKTA